MHECRAESRAGGGGIVGSGVSCVVQAIILIRVELLECGSSDQCPTNDEVASKGYSLTMVGAGRQTVLSDFWPFLNEVPGGWLA